MLTLAIPNWNGARFLEETLISLERNRPHVRWWFQDSCSSDDSAAIAERYAGPLDHIQVERDQGQADGLNRSISKMGGDIIGFLNSDDLLAEGAAEAVLAAFEADPSLDMVYGRVEWIDENGKSQGFHHGDISNFAQVIDIYRFWWNRKQWVQPEVFWRRSVWERVGPINTSYDLAFDYEYWVRCFQSGVKVKSLPQTLARFRRHSAQKSTNALKAANEIRTIVSKALEAPNPLGVGARIGLRNRLSYDVYRCAQNTPGGEKFWKALAAHPAWLALPEVRHRLRQSKKMGTILGSSL